MLEHPDLPLFRWGESLPAARLGRRWSRRRLAVVAASAICVASTIIVPPRPRLVWNASASAPVGLYLVSKRSAIARGEMAIAWPPASARKLAARRRYLPANVPLLKRVAAIEGDEICARGGMVTVNGKIVAIRRSVDGKARPLPAWNGCVSLRPGMLLLLIAARPDSFDGRYFGPTIAADVIGKATPLWLR